MKLISQPATKDKAAGRPSGGLAMLYDEKLVKNLAVVESNEVFQAFKITIDNENILLVNVYLRDVHYGTRLESLQEFLEQVTEIDEQQIVLIGGDFNGRVGLNNQLDEDLAEGTGFCATRRSKDHKINKNGKELLGVMESMGMIILNGRAHSDYEGELTFVSQAGQSVIDHVWCNADGFRVLSDFQVRNLSWSDHQLIKVKLEVRCVKGVCEKKGNRVKTLRFGWDPAKAEDYYNIMQRTRCSRSSENDIEELSNEITHAIKATATKLGMVREVTLGMPSKDIDKSWYDADCKASKRKLNQAYRKHKNIPSDEHRIEYARIRTVFTKLVRSKRKEARIKAQKELCEVRGMRQFWLLVNKYRRKARRVCPIEVRAWERFYSSLFPPSMDVEGPFQDCRHPILDQDITYSEVLEVLKASKAGKSPGPDGLSNGFFRGLSKNWIYHLVRLFNKILEVGEIPNDWAKAEVVLLYKKGDENDPCNYRGIALANSISKIFTSIVAKRLSKWCEAAGLLPEGQNGFRAGRSCEDNVFVLSTKIAQALNAPGGRLCAAFVDYRRAFDSVSHKILWQKLYQIGVSARLIKTLQDYYNKARIKVRVNQGQVTKEINVTEGILQGDPLSAILFIMFIADAAEFYVDKGYLGIEKRMEILLFADDKTILAGSEAELQYKLRVLEEYCDRNELQVNTDKTKIIIFKAKGARAAKKKIIKYKGSALEEVSSFVYLGVPFASNGLFGQACDYFVTKAKLAIGAVWRTMMVAKMTRWDQRIHLFNSIVAAALLYCSSIWGHRYIDELDKVARTFLKQLLGLPRGTPGYSLRVETGSVSLEVSIIKRIIKFWTRISNMAVERYPRQCLTILKDLHGKASNKRKLNWYSLTLDLMKKHGINVSNDGGGPEDGLEDCLKVIVDRQKEEDKRRVLLSSYHPLYKVLNEASAGERAKYVTLHVPLSRIRILAQARMAWHKITIFRLDGMKYQLDATELCMVCKNGENETLEHFMCSCATYEEFRVKYLGMVLFPEVLNADSKEQLKNIYIYIRNCLTLRAFILNE